MQVAFQTDKTLDQVHDALQKIDVEGICFGGKFDEKRSLVYAVSYSEPFESPKTLDDFTEDEIRTYLRKEYN